MVSSSKKVVVDLVNVAFQKGVEHVVISPGSRNAPLTIAFNRHGGFKMHCIVDERSAAFFALGIAQQTQKPVAICCTSGTAALNYAPAIAEAYYQKIPLLVLTADRPKEWIDQMDGQTIRQFSIFQNYIKDSFEFPTEPKAEEEYWHCFRISCEAIEKCNYPEAGPVHINIPFREPLYELVDYPAFENAVPFSTIKTKLELSGEEALELIEEWKASDKILIVTGLLHPSSELNDVLSSISNQDHVAIITETTSNIFGDKFNRSIDRIIATLENNEDVSDYQPDLLITIGGPVVSKKIKTFLRKNKPNKHWHINASNDFVDTYKSLSKIIPVEPVKALKLFSDLKSSSSSSFRKNWLSLDKKLTELFQEFLKNMEFSDLSVFNTVLNQIPSKSYLQLANSTAVRYSNLFNECSDRQIYCYSNRGTSGIDGTISTAVGAALVHDEITTVITGDLSFLYDSNALWINEIPKTLRIIVINNGGGNIFRIIDGPSKTEELEQFFDAKPQVNIKSLVQSFNLKYYFSDNQSSLNEVLAEAYQNNEACVVEVKTESTKNPIILKEYFKYLKSNI